MVDRSTLSIEESYEKSAFRLNSMERRNQEPNMCRQGISHSRRLQAGLKEIADWILPREKRACIYEVEIEHSIADLLTSASRPS